MSKQITPINIIEIDSRDARFQTGIGRYIETLSSSMPPNVKVYQIILLFSPDYHDIHIETTDEAVYVRHPMGFPGPKLYDVVITMIGAKLMQMPNIVVKCNCLGVEGLAYMIRAQFYCKCIGVLHCLPHCGKNPMQNFPQNPYFNMDQVVLVCEAGIKYMELVHNTRPCMVIYNGLEAPKIQKKNTDDNGVFRFIFANGWAEHKGLKRILPAIRKVSQQRKISVMVLGGEPTLDDDFKAQLEGLPIERVGLVYDPAEIDKYYNMADCALFASYSEACSYAGIEAMAYNLPIVSSDAVGLVEMFGKKAALIVNSNDKAELDTDAYADAMMRIIDSSALRLRLGIAAYARYRERYTMKRMSGAYMDLYRRLLGC